MPYMYEFWKVRGKKTCMYEFWEVGCTNFFLVHTSYKKVVCTRKMSYVRVTKNSFKFSYFAYGRTRFKKSCLWLFSYMFVFFVRRTYKKKVMHTRKKSYIQDFFFFYGPNRLPYHTETNNKKCPLFPRSVWFLSQPMALTLLVPRWQGWRSSL